MMTVNALDNGPAVAAPSSYLVLSGTMTAARCPEIARELLDLGFTTVIAIPTPNASRVLAPRELADVAGVRVVQSYFDMAIRPRPPRGPRSSSTSWRWPLPPGRC